MLERYFHSLHLKKKPMELSIIYYMEIGFVSIQPSTIVSLGQLSINNYLILKSIIQFFRFLEETTIKSKRLSLNIKLGVSYAYLKLFQSLNYLLIFPMTKIRGIKYIENFLIILHKYLNDRMSSKPTIPNFPMIHLRSNQIK